MDTKKYAARLQEEKEKLENELSRIGRRNPHNAGDFEAIPEDTGQEADSVDRAELLEAYAENVAILHELELRYTDVTDALIRIEKGTYGTCEVGGERIEKERLDADPAARTCKAHL